MANLSLADLIKLNDQNLSDANVSDLLQDAPLLAAMPAILATQGVQHSYLKETGAPTVGFRAINAGMAYTNSDADTAVTIALKYLDFSWEEDVQVFHGLLKAEEIATKKTARSLKAAMFAFEKQIINGADADVAGFAGFATALSALSNAMVVNAGGASSCTSVYGVRLVPDDIVAVAGNGGNFVVGTPTEQRKLDGSGQPYDVLRCVNGGHGGVQVGGACSIGRIANLSALKPLTDDLLAQLIARFPVGRQPTHLVMNRTARLWLQNSRTATNPTGAPAPFPLEAFGLPIITVESITDTESAIS